MAKKQDWTTLSVKPLTGLLDVRSRPADIAPGGFRWRQNLACSDEGKAKRRDGFGRAFADLLFDNDGVLLTAPGDHEGIVYHNPDLHHQGGTREQIKMLFESTSSTGLRSLFSATDTRIYTLDESTAYWTTIATGLTPFGTHFKAAELQDHVVFTNTTNDVLYHVLNSGSTATIPDLISLKVTKARVVIQFAGFMILMNHEQDDGSGYVRKNTRIRWSDLNLPLAWDPSQPDSLASFQDLPYGDEILAAIELLGAVYIFTRRSIWKMTANPNPTTEADFSFVRVYTEPKNQTGCLLFPNTLISDGQNLWYMSREGIYKYNPFLPAPEREEWLHLATGVIYTKEDTKLSGIDCESPVAEYRSVTGEMWNSWPSGGRTINNWTLVSKLAKKAADVIDHGFTTFSNYRRTPAGLLCNETQSLLGVSGQDWAIKDIGGVFYREFVTIGDVITDDLELNSLPAVYNTEGYMTQVRGLIPTGLHDREKIIRNLMLDHDTTEQDDPCIARLRIGNSYHLADPNNEGSTCAVQWAPYEDLPLSCPDVATIPAMTALNQRPSDGTEWALHRRGRYLYFELSILNSDGTPAVGGDSAWERFDFDLFVAVKA